MSDNHRRDFVRGLALGASASLLAAPGAFAADDPKKDEPKKDETPPRSEADARMDFVLARFGKHLDEDARKGVRAEISQIIARADRLRKFELSNFDGPLPIFVPYRAPDA
jgi:hypothetical protein